MRKLTALLTAFLLCVTVCVGCAMENPLNLNTEAGGERRFRLSIQKDISSDASRGLDVFIAKVESLSEGRIKIEKSVCDDPIAALDAGSDLVFASNSEITRANGDFLSYTSPFYFSDYTHLTITLNCEEFREETGEKTSSLLGASSLAAFYGGSRMFLSNESDILDVVQGWKEISVGIASDEDLLAVVLRSMGADVSERSQTELMDLFLNGRLRTIDCGVTELTRLSSGKVHDTQIYAYPSFHTATINWLMISDSTLASLDDFEQAVLTEASAYAIAANDTAVREEEEKALSYLDTLEIPLYEIRYSDFSAQADTAFQNEVRYRNLWDWQLHSELRSLALTS
jgi:TRAP-type C4-dicarboxylate transport system substrate-binding protein